MSFAISLPLYLCGYLLSFPSYNDLLIENLFFAVLRTPVQYKVLARGSPWDLRYLMTVGLKNRPRATRVKNCVIVRHVGLIIIIGLIIFTTEGITNIITRGQSNLTKSASRGANSPVRGHPRVSKVVPFNSWGRVSY